MEQMFIRILNMSLTAGLTILAIIAVRFFLRRFPRIFSYVLWIAVLFRLLCPVSFSAPFSLPGLLRAPGPDQGEISYIPDDIGYMNRPEVHLPGSALTHMANASLPQGTPERSVNPIQLILFAGSVFWIAGMVLMILYSMVSYGNLRRKLKGSVREEDNIYRTSHGSVPFVCGFFRPRIYLPSALEKEERAYILLHEQIHIRRGDPIWRALGYLALCIHWFNPLVWAAFFLSGRDMEMSCDEAVIQKLGNGVKKQYSSSLLTLSCGRRVISGIPPAFGEGGAGGRIKNLFRYRSAGKRTAAALALLCFLIILVLGANPPQKSRADLYSCYKLPIGGGALEWGMSADEIAAIFGEPSSMERSNAGVALTYNTQIPGSLGDCSGVVFYVGENNLTDSDGTVYSAGLCNLIMTIDDTTKEELLSKMTDFYGKLSPSGGSTQMEFQLKQANPDYFNEAHFCESWKIGNLPQKEYDRLVQVYRQSLTPSRPIDENRSLMWICFRGVATDSTYTCTVQLDASQGGVMSCLVNPGQGQ